MGPVVKTLGRTIAGLIVTGFAVKGLMDIIDDTFDDLLGEKEKEKIRNNAIYLDDEDFTVV